jgi:hypothetical protein
MIQTHVADLAGQLAEKVCERAGGRLAKAFFASSGSEGVEAAIKFARAYAARRRTLSRTCVPRADLRGAIADERQFCSEGFGPLLPEIAAIPFWRPGSAGTRTEEPALCGVMARCLCWMKCGPACTEPDLSLPRPNSELSLTWSSWPRPGTLWRSADVGCGVQFGLFVITAGIRS